MSTDRVNELRALLRPNRPPTPDLGAPILQAVDRQASLLRANREPALGDRVVISDTSLNFGDLNGRAAVLREVRDDEDGYDYRVTITDTVGLVTQNGVYETWVSGVAPAPEKWGH
jgi:hypothetical protein